ncbi:phage prohead protease, HK97 family protein [Pseudooceanicola batsensis HTCC2597]|uniref:Phage prohead protease, HK97 family protein n=1 Tax=Pseudooceanicola batsensis (strain ATCC BAA-863 / DSM 15984 / KCTC 12145 / HTCC2597) TaxID=252305 RepID=A3U3P9_PSEBH|nr:HK97 family phage prohead protease [Pseudooceanicola batsensis]EAQ01251.1 phage prohead protease, HK97 family protein [Pseudooceanicola batsensis HTCC2597]
MELEHKFCAFDADLSVSDDLGIAGYASRFGAEDQGGDVVQRGAFAASLASGRGAKMLWQHDPAQPIGVWTEMREDNQGLWVAGRLLDGVARAKEAAALIRAGAIDGLSVGYRTRRATKNEGGGRTLMELELWEVSLVTFPMLPSARVAAKGDTPGDTLRDLAAVFDDARLTMAGRRPG